MKVNQLLKTAALVLLVTLGFTKTNAQSSRTVSVSNISSLGVSNGMDLYLTQGNTESLVIKGTAGVIKDVVVEQKDGRVSIKYKDGINWSRLFRNESIKIYVTFKKLKGLSASGGSDVLTENTITTESISISASGGSDLELNLACKDLQLSVSGGSDAKLRGNAENMSITANGGSDVDAFSLVSNYAKVNATGGSDVNLTVNKGIEAGATGGSDISYKGSAVLKKTSNSHSGDVSHVK